MGKGPDRFFKKKNVFILEAHGSERRDEGRANIPEHAHVALLKDCGTLLLISDKLQDSLYAYNKDILIPASRSNVARTEHTLQIKGDIQNELMNLKHLRAAEFKVYAPPSKKSFDGRYNTLPPLYFSPFLIIVNSITRNNITYPYFANDAHPYSPPNDKHKLLEIYSSGLYSKVHMPQLPAECKEVPESEAHKRLLKHDSSPYYMPKSIMIPYSENHYIMTLSSILHLYFVARTLMMIRSMTHGSYLSFEDICLYGLITYKLVPVPPYLNSYDTYLHVKQIYEKQFVAELEQVVDAYKSSRTIDILHSLSSPVWNMTLAQLINIDIPLIFIIQFIQARYTHSAPMMLIAPICRYMSCAPENNIHSPIPYITSTTQCAIRGRRQMSQRSPVETSRASPRRGTKRRRRYKWRNKTVKAPTPSSVSSSVVSNLGYGNYGDLPNDL